MMGSIDSQNKKITIKHEHLILCEGQDEYFFLHWYLDSNERRSQDERFSEAVQVLSFGGNEELRAFLRTLQKVEGYTGVKTILIIRDAESDAARAVEQVKSALGDAGMSVPAEPGVWSCDSGKPYFSFLLFPELGRVPQNGTLEQLCMDMIREKYDPDIVLGKVDSFMDSLSADGLRKYDHAFKTRIHSFLSVTDPFPGMKIGEAARAGAFDWNSDRLKGLNDCLMEGFELD